MASAKPGDTVHVHYTGRLDDGSVFDTSEGREPLEFVLGTGSVIPGFEEAVSGLSVGEEASTRIPPEQAYGLRSEALVLTVPRQNFPEGAAPEVGQRFEMASPDGQHTPIVVTSVEADTVQIDANHPLAGRALSFDLKLVKIA
jgi:peptidylprolyl isomerase